MEFWAVISALWLHSVMPRHLKSGPHSTACQIPALNMREVAARLVTSQSLSLSLIRTLKVDISIRAQPIETNFTASLPLQQCLHETLTFHLYLIAGHLILLFMTYFRRRRPLQFIKNHYVLENWVCILWNKIMELDYLCLGMETQPIFRKEVVSVNWDEGQRAALVWNMMSHHWQELETYLSSVPAEWIRIMHEFVCVSFQMVIYHLWHLCSYTLTRYMFTAGPMEKFWYCNVSLLYIVGVNMGFSP